MDEYDRLAPVRAHFYLQRYTDVLHSTETLSADALPTALQSEYALFLHRAQLALIEQQPATPFSTALPPLEPHLQPLFESYAAFLQTERQQQTAQADGLATKANGLLSDLNADASAADAIKVAAAQLVATLLLRSQRLEEAARCIQPFSESHPEAGALLVQIYLLLNRVDSAGPIVDHLKKKFPDAVPTLLSEAWHMLHLGEAKAQNAFYIFQELIETYGPSIVATNGQAACAMIGAQFADAEKMLATDDGGSTLINQLAVATFLNRPPETLAAIFQKLQQSSGQHVMLQEMMLKASLFDRCAASYPAAF